MSLIVSCYTLGTLNNVVEQILHMITKGKLMYLLNTDATYVKLLISGQRSQSRLQGQKFQY